MQWGVVGWAQAANWSASALPQCLCHHIHVYGASGADPALTSLRDVPTCHPLLQNCNQWSWMGKMDLQGCSHTAGVQRSFFFRDICCLCFFFSSPHLESCTTEDWTREILTLLALFYNGVFHHSGSFFTVCLISSKMQNYQKHTYLMRSNGVFSQSLQQQNHLLSICWPYEV